MANIKPPLSKKDQLKLQKLLYKEFSSRIDLEEKEEKKIFKELSSSFFKNLKKKQSETIRLNKISEIKLKSKSKKILHSYYTGKKETKIIEIFELSKKMRSKNLAKMTPDDQTLFFSPILNKILKMKIDKIKFLGFHGKFYVESSKILPFTHLEVPTHLFTIPEKNYEERITQEFKSVFEKAYKIYLGYQNSASGYSLEQFERNSYLKNDIKTKKKEKK